MTDNHPVDPKALRVSDDERNHVVQVLQKAIGHGLIDLDEFTERTDIALAARTRGELNAVLVDLPGLHHADNAPAEQPVELRSTMSSIKRSGAWQVPRHLVVRSRMGSTELDFTEARVAHRQVDIELDVVGGSVELLFPRDAGVRSTGVTMVAGSLEDKRPTEHGSPLYVVRGSVRGGSVQLRRPVYLRLGALVLRLPFQLRIDRQRRIGEA